jgi:hypothetical protein
LWYTLISVGLPVGIVIWHQVIPVTEWVNTNSTRIEFFSQNFVSFFKQKIKSKIKFQKNSKNIIKKITVFSHFQKLSTNLGFYSMPSYHRPLIMSCRRRNSLIPSTSLIWPAFLFYSIILQFFLRFQIKLLQL